jgi:hypothetical protein
MSKKLIYLVSFGLVLGLADYVSAAQNGVEIPSVGYPKPILDGVMDGVWLLSTEQIMTLFTGEEPTSPEDCSASWWALWDMEYLYVLVDVTDEALIQDSDPSQGWLDDRVEIFIDGDNSKDDAPDGKNDYQYNFRWNHGKVETPVEWYFRATPHPSGSSLEGVEYGVATTDSGYLVEAKMPWSTMTGEAPYEEQLIGINVMIDDDDDGGAEDTQFQWFTETTTPHVPSLWGTAVLVAGAGEPWLYVAMPNPTDGVMLEDTWANLSWKPGGRAVSHDIYLGDNFDDVNAGAESAFQGNQTITSLLIGFPGFPYPDGLVPGTTYYWRIDEVNDAEPNSPWVGPVWSFMVPPKTAYWPDPADGAEQVNTDVELSWTAGFGAKLHTVYFGENFDDVNNATEGLTQGITAYTPGPLKLSKTYYWRIDEFDALKTYKGDVWSFTTEGAVGNPNPSNGAVGVEHTPVLTWTPGVYAASHQLYFGIDKDAVRDADTTSPQFKATKALGSESYDPGKLQWYTTYYWRIDEVNDLNPDSPWTGSLWSFTTADFIVIDDFEDYNDYPPDEIFSMPLYYDNNFMYSEATMTLVYPRDWTEEGVGALSLWFRGNSDNAAERMYVNLNGIAIVYHDNPNAAQIAKWTEWRIDLQEFAAQGVNLANVNTISIGFGDKNNLQAGGAGMVLFDDIRLYRPAP